MAEKIEFSQGRRDALKFGSGLLLGAATEKAMNSLLDSSRELTEEEKKIVEIFQQEAKALFLFNVKHTMEKVEKKGIAY